MSKSKQKVRNENNAYYKKVLLQFLGLEREVYSHTNSSVKFYFNNSVLILWTGANKIQEARTGKWISNADEYIIRNVLKEKDVPTMYEWNNSLAYA